jgi:hypothetical protein
MLARVKRIEAVRAPMLSPIALAFGSFDTFTAWAEKQMAAGVLDRGDFPVVVHCLASWERDSTWSQALTPAMRTPDRYAQGGRDRCWGSA